MRKIFLIPMFAQLLKNFHLNLVIIFKPFTNLFLNSKLISTNAYFLFNLKN